MSLRGRDAATGKPTTVEITAADVHNAIQPPLQALVENIRDAFENIPPELAEDILPQGLYLTGGGALLQNLDKLLSHETGMPVLVSEDALSCVGEGTGRSLENIELLKRVVMTGKKLRS